MPLPFLATLLIALVVNVAAYMLMPRARQDTPASTTEKQETPIADAGVPIPVIFGEVDIRAPNCLGWWDKAVDSYDVDA